MSADIRRIGLAVTGAQAVLELVAKGLGIDEALVTEPWGYEHAGHEGQ